MSDPHPSLTRLRAFENGKLRKSSRVFAPTRPKSKRKAREAPLQTRLVVALRKRLPEGSLVWHTPNQRRDKLDAIRLKMMGAVAGMPDLFVIADDTCMGRGIYAIECKAKSSSTSDAQEHIRQQLTQLGVLYFVARDVDAALEWIGQFVPLKEKRP